MSIFNLSKNSCEWHFAPFIGGFEKGPNDAQTETIRGNPYRGLVRECVQNSMDAVYDESKPVTVKFSVGHFSKDELKGFFELKEHIQACMKYFSNDMKAQKKFQEMAEVFQSGLISYINVSDYNTKGMPYVKDDTGSPFYAFVRSAGVSVKGNNKTGGSFGFGKSAYFKISPIRTLFISTKTPDGEVAFEGVSWLCTHKHRGEIVSDAGFFDNNGGYPITQRALIPSSMLRDEPGTSFYILGLKQNSWDKIFQDMLKEALQNFWLAIYEGKLELIIDGKKISKDNLEIMLKLFFPEEVDLKPKTHDYNPYPYFKMVKNAELDKNIKKIEKQLPALGSVILYLSKIPGAKDKVIYMRRPLMTVFGKSTRTSYGIYGLFLCTNQNGDKILRNMENPAHDEWKANNYINQHNEIVGIAKEAEKQIKEFIQKEIADAFGHTDEASLEITGLDEILYIPEDLLDHGQQDQIPDENQGNIQEPDIKLKKSQERKKPPLSGSVIVTEKGSFNPQDENIQRKKPVGIGHKQHISKTKGGKPGAGNNFEDRKVTDKDDDYKTLIPVTFRTFAFEVNHKIYHKLIINSPQEIIAGEIEIMVAGDDNDDVIPLNFSTVGMIKDNKIIGVNLRTGKNQFQICFQDDQKHSIRLEAYENK